jgi:hypothetical protein
MALRVTPNCAAISDPVFLCIGQIATSAACWSAVHVGAQPCPSPSFDFSPSPLEVRRKNL